jgi:hypothetical protein
MFFVEYSRPTFAKCLFKTNFVKKDTLRKFVQSPISMGFFLGRIGVTKATSLRDFMDG